MPVYNEGENITRVLENLLAEVGDDAVEVLVVYDFDEDNTVPVVERLQGRFPQIRLQRNDIGRGVLNALRKGFQVARAPFVLVIMADGSDEPEVIRTMLRRAQDGADVVAGSRYMRGGGQERGPLLKRTIWRSAGLSLPFVARAAVHDSSRNFRLHSPRPLDAVTLYPSTAFQLTIH